LAGIGGNSDVRDSFGLAKIDNTPDGETGQRAEQANSTDALTEAVLRNPIIGEDVSNFEVIINGIADPRFNDSSVVSGPLWYHMFGEIVVSDLNPDFGEDNSIDVGVTVNAPGKTPVKIKTHGKIKGGLNDGKKKKRNMMSSKSSQGGSKSASKRGGSKDVVTSRRLLRQHHRRNLREVWAV
jgi:hypothetical protein